MTLPYLFKTPGLFVKVILITYVLSFLGATYNHLMDLVKGGFLPCRNANVPFILNVYWTPYPL